MISFSGTVKNLDGSDMMQDGEPIYLNKSLANNLAMSTKGDAIKFYDWALRLYKDGGLDIDRSDWEVLKKFVKEMENAANTFKAQLLERFILQPE